ncbi:MAG: FAD-dependent oxidoreductase [Paracoccaceae bacterium]|nr:FAD-dependent oxidoreductase [Paracoccaceae bacterium]
MSACDILVIGGGIAGVSAAAHLAASADVTLIEAEPALGAHATGRSAAIFIRNYGNATLRALNDVAAQAYASDALAGILSPRGELLVATEDELPAFRAYLDGADGIDVLTRDEALAHVPVLRGARIAAAAIERDARDIDVDALLQRYRRLFRTQGGTLVLGQKVTGIDRQAGLWRVQTPNDTYSAPLLINAAGAWVDEIAALAGVTPMRLQPKRRSAVLMPLPDTMGDITHWPLFGSVTETWYAKPMSGKLMISPADTDPIPPQDAWADDLVIAEGLARFHAMVDLPLQRPSHSWAGLRSFAPDATPVVGFAHDAPGFFWLAGQGGYGVQTAPALAALTTDLCLGKPPALPQSVTQALSPARFAH